MTRSEFRWVLIASLAVILLASLPTLYAWTLADADHVFSGFVYNTEDGNSYIAKMRLGARGEWLFHVFYTAEEHDPAMAFPFHILLGKLAVASGLSLVTTYHLARVAFGLILLLTVYAFVGYFTPDIVVRRVAWALVAIGSGVGWLLILLGLTNWLGALPLDFWVPEAYAFLVLYNLPHLALAQSLLLWAILWTLQSHDRRNLTSVVKAGLAALGMTLVVPFYAGVLAAVLGAYLLAVSIQERSIPWRWIGQTALVGAFAAPVVAYNAWVFTTNPAFRIWAAQNTILSPHPVHYVLGYLPLLIPAIPGAVHTVRQKDRHWLLPLTWVLVVPFLLYAPINLQRRMCAAVQVPLALLAAKGMVTWFGQRRWPLAACIAIASLSNLLLVAGSFGPIQQRTAPIYRPGDEVAALEWLAAHAQPDETVLASFQVSNVIPARTDLRVFAGHGPETLYSTEKQANIHRFFQPDTDDAWRHGLLREFGIDYVLFGPAEQELGDWDPSSAEYLDQCHRVGEYAILSVVLEERQP